MRTTSRITDSGDWTMRSKVDLWNEAVDAGERRARVAERRRSGEPRDGDLDVDVRLRRRERPVEDEVLVPELEADGGEHARELLGGLGDHVGAARSPPRRSASVDGSYADDLSPTAKTRALSFARPLTDSSLRALAADIGTVGEQDDGADGGSGRGEHVAGLHEGVVDLRAFPELRRGGEGSLDRAPGRSSARARS